MKKILGLALAFDIHGLLIKPTSDVSIQALRTFFVGGIGSAVDISVLWLISLTGLHYLICTVMGFSMGVAVHFMLSVKFVFKERPTVGRFSEVVIYVGIAIVSLGLTAGMVWLLTEVFGIFFMISRVVTVFPVFAIGFAIRKAVLYRG